jgi:hypothetical protein
MKNVILAFAVIAISQSAFAFDYTCKYVQGDDGEFDTTTISINANEVKVTQTQSGNQPIEATGKRNRSYSPRTGDENYVEYNSVDGLGGDEGEGELLAEKQLLRGAQEGRIKIRFRGEGFENTMYSCTLQ